jgi:predicted phage terminase large subunit-like protein
MIKATAESDGPECIVLVEANGSQKGYADQMKEEIQNRVVEPDVPEGSKEMRASIWGTRLQDGIIYVVRGEWNQALFDEMDYFPNGEHDDQVDAVSGAWNRLNSYGANAQVVDHRSDVERIPLQRYSRRGGLL